jgi:hypothetical protein
MYRAAPRVWHCLRSVAGQLIMYLLSLLLGFVCTLFVACQRLADAAAALLITA